MLILLLQMLYYNRHCTPPPNPKMNFPYVWWLKIVFNSRFPEYQSPRFSKCLRVFAFAYPYLFDNIPLFYRVGTRLCTSHPTHPVRRVWTYCLLILPTLANMSIFSPWLYTAWDKTKNIDTKLAVSPSSWPTLYILLVNIYQVDQHYILL